MMQSLRDNMKLIIWITAIVFLVGFGILELGGVLGDNPSSRGPNGVIAEVNGEPIRVEEFMQAYNQMLRQLQATRELQPGEDSYVREQAWQTLVRNKLLMQEARRRGLHASPDEIKMALRVAPPDFIVQAEGFQTNGQFDYRKYLAELDNPNSQVPWGQVEALVAETLPVQKLQEQIVAAAKVSEGDLRDRFLLQNEKLNLRFLAFPADSFDVDTTRIGGADVESYYKAHPEDFTGPAVVKVAVLLVPRKPDPSDFSTAKERMRAVLEQARAQPDSFASIARTRSEIQSASRGGDPGVEPFLDEMRPAFRQGLQGVGAGQISDIIQEERSLHIFKVEKRVTDPASKRERIKYREIAIRVEPGQGAVSASRAMVEKIEKEAKRSGVNAAATKAGLRTMQSEWFARGMSGNDILQRFPEVETWMFKAKAGDLSAPVPTEQGWFLYQIVDTRKEGQRPLSSVPVEAKMLLINSLRLERAKEAASQARAALLAGADPAQIAARFRARDLSAEGVTRNGYLAPIGSREAKVIGALLAQPLNSWSPVLRGIANVYIFRVLSHQVPTEEEFRKQEAQIRDQLLNERRQVLYVEWVQALRQKAKIKDFRTQYFEA
jgi:hypothetical protein